MTTAGILYICTGKYIQFWDEFYKSSQQYLLPNVKKVYFVFTDGELNTYGNRDVHTIYQEQLPFPYPTLYRFRYFLKAEQQLAALDYIYFFNSNIIFKQTITEQEFLPGADEDLVAILHPGYYDSPPETFTLEKNKRSTAYVPYTKVKHYYAGGLMGGKSADFITACKKIDANIRKDEKWFRMAVWHDESHWNHYLSTGVKYKTLNPGYMYAEGFNMPFEVKALLLNKSKVSDINQLRKFTLKDKLIKWLKKQKAALRKP